MTNSDSCGESDKVMAFTALFTRLGTLIVQTVCIPRRVLEDVYEVKRTVEKVKCAADCRRRR
jgi:hypothetical protein